MIAQGRGGRIVFVTSEGAEMAGPGYGAYCVSKVAQKMIMRIAATELGAHGITANAVLSVGRGAWCPWLFVRAV